MDRFIRNFLIIIVIILILFILLSQITKPDVSNEYYTKSFDPLYVDPHVHPYSRDIEIRPDTEDIFSTNDELFGKIYDHLDSQGDNVTQNEIPVVDNNFIMEQEDRLANKRVRFAPCHEVIRYGDESIKQSSYYDTDLNVNYPIDTNNVGEFCGHKNNGNTAITNMDMDMDDKTYYDMIKEREGTKTFIQIDDMGDYDNENNKGVQDIGNLQEITDVINKYRNNTLDTIIGPICRNTSKIE